MQIGLGCNNVDAAGAKAIATALASGKCPSRLYMDFTDNSIGDEGAQAIAKALESGNCPADLHINLQRTQIGAKGARAITIALQSGNCPAGLKINLEGNSIYDKALQALEEIMIKNTTCTIKNTLSLLIDQMNTRNKLIAEYPNHKGYILSLCHKHNLYKPLLKAVEIRSLKDIASHFIYNAKNIQEVKAALPKPILDFMNEITYVETVLRNIIRKEDYDSGACYYPS